MSKKNYEKNYKIARGIGVPIFKMIYRPQIKGIENIPQDQPLIFYGNHRHVFDQFPVICGTSKYIRWLAKKEYFDSKLKWFYEKIGCISIDRDGDTSLAMEEAYQTLEKGDNIGLFPEGTRNIYSVALEQRDEILKKISSQSSEYSKTELIELKLKLIRVRNLLDRNKKILEERGFEVRDNDILLGFKKGGARLAIESNTLLQPFVITGDYKVNSKNLQLTFGETINPKGHTVDSLNEEMRFTTKKMILKK